MNAFHCFCEKHDRLKHRGVVCDECNTEVRFRGYSWGQIVQIRVSQIRERVRWVVSQWWKGFNL